MRNPDNIELLKEEIGLKKGDKFRLVYAEPLDPNNFEEGFTTGLADYYDYFRW
jgi:uncharacterized protein YneR